jgi:hypothetical protein
MVKRTGKRTRSQELFDTLPPFNNKEALTVVRLDQEGTLGVVDASTFGVYIEKSMEYSLIPHWRSLSRVTIPTIPNHYGYMKGQWIGGVSKTFRRIGCLRTKTKVKSPVTLFATKLPDEHAATRALCDFQETATVGDSETIDDPAYGTIAEVVVHSASDVDFVAARLAREGGSVMFEDHTQNALQGIGIERLDRIDADIVKKDTEDDRKAPEDFGLGRGDENWIFPWLPVEWNNVPITWDYMVKNMDYVEDVSKIPQPLRQHVAKGRYMKCEDKTTDYAKSLRGHVFCKNGQPKRRCVSAGLSKAQSIQVIDAFYLLTIERVQDPETVHAASLILFHYMLRQGYTGRWMGKYQQEAKFIGNGDVTRKFHRLEQYDPHRLPTAVLNKLVSQHGIVKGKGNKGSRSKYVEREERYVPKQRVPRNVREQQRERMVNKSRATHVGTSAS